MENNLRATAVGACLQALRTLARILLKHGVMHKEFVELSKEAYVGVARRDYGIGGRPTNASRVALLTGLDRKEVARINAKAADGARQEPERRQDRIARVLSGWHQDADFTDDLGLPLRLPLEGEAPSFAALVRRYGGDVPAVTILRELKRTGAVQVDGDVAQVLRRNYRLDTVDAESLTRAGDVLADLCRTVTHNLYRESGESSRFEARATNARIPDSALPAYRAMIYAEAQAFLERVDAWLSEHELAESGDSADPARGAVGRVGLGVYWIQTDDEAAS